MQPEYSPAWSRLCAAAPMPICTGENLFRRHGFRDFIVNQGCDILHPDLRNSGGFLETKRIADFAEVYNLPMATHNTGSQLNTWGTVHWGGSIRDYIACETVTGKGDWMDQVLALDRPYIKGGMIELSNKPGLGVELNEDVVKAHLATGESWWG
jgi:L-alanine-DL-glutamate epimerase-like enolase superfamily enzyme